MAFLDFIKNRQATQQQPVAETSQAKKPDTAKEMYTRQAAQEKAQQRPVAQMSDGDLAKARAAAERIDRATQHIQPQAQSAAPSGSTSPQPMRQQMTGQENTAPALSPTSGQAGKTAQEQSTQKAPEKTRAQTVPRPRPSWER